MKTRSILLATFVCLFLGFSFASCDDDDEKIKLPTEVVAGLSFIDTDLTEGKIAGTVKWNALYSTGDIRQFVIYLSADGTSRDQKLGEVDVETLSFDIPEGTSYNKYVLVVAANGLGEAASAASLEIVDAVNQPIPLTEVTGYYVLNGGKYQSNNASLYFYDMKNNKMETDVFKTANGRALGDQAQDILVYGTKMYIAMYGSGTIEVTDLEGKSLKQVKSADENLLPRSLAAHEGKVYMSLYDGFVARLDTLSLEIEAKVAVGDNPEDIVVVGDKLYVANCGGMSEVLGNTVSVIDLPSFTEEDKIEVVPNPNTLLADNEGDIYLISWGNWAEIPYTLQRIDGETRAVESLISATEMTFMNDKIYTYYSDWNWVTNTGTITYYCYDTVEEKFLDDVFNIDAKKVAQPYRIFADPENDYVWVAESDYNVFGDLYIFSQDGEFVKKQEVGLNPEKMVKVTYYK